MDVDAQLTEEQNELIKSVADKEGIHSYDLKAQSCSLKGEGYMGIITTVSIKNSSKKLELILKAAHKSEIFRKTAPVREAYLREIFSYNTIFPKFRQFKIENGDLNGFSGYAKIYGSCDKELNECLLLENLKENGYKLWNRKVPMNSDHVRLVFTEYAKFHTISLAMRHKQPETYKALTENLGNIFEKMMTDVHMIKATVETAFKAVANNSFATDAVRRFASQAEKIFSEDIKVKEDHIVITHGDCWCNNMMFKYEDPRDCNKPTKVCLLDWQVSKTGSPVLDLAYFFSVSSSKEILYDYKKYLKIYHDTVAEHLKNMSCDADEIFPYSLLEQHWKKYSRYGLYVAILLVKIIESDADVVPDFVELAEAGQNIMEGLNSHLMSMNDYSQRITDIVVFMAEHDFI